MWVNRLVGFEELARQCPHVRARETLPPPPRRPPLPASIQDLPPPETSPVFRCTIKSLFGSVMNENLFVHQSTYTFCYCISWYPYRLLCDRVITLVMKRLCIMVTLSSVEDFAWTVVAHPVLVFCSCVQIMGFMFKYTQLLHVMVHFVCDFQVTARVLFGSVNAISTLQAERKRRR